MPRAMTSNPSVQRGKAPAAPTALHSAGLLSAWFGVRPCLMTGGDSINDGSKGVPGLPALSDAVT